MPSSYICPVKTIDSKFGSGLTLDSIFGLGLTLGINSKLSTSKTNLHLCTLNSSLNLLSETVCETIPDSWSIFRSPMLLMLVLLIQNPTSTWHGLWIQNTHQKCDCNLHIKMSVMSCQCCHRKHLNSHWSWREED